MGSALLNFTERPTALGGEARNNNDLITRPWPKQGKLLQNITTLQVVA